MKEKNYKPLMPDLMEAIFDAGYLIFDLIAGILFFAFAKGNTLFVLYGILTLTLCGGDAFHLVPRIIRAVRGSNDKIKKMLGRGLQISSITMTAFYIILRISSDKNGCSNYYFFRMLYSGNLVQQNKTKSRIIDDPKDLCIYVDHCNGTGTVILTESGK